MGVAGLWDVLRPVSKQRSMTHLAVLDGFEANPDGCRGFRVGIDASIWLYHAANGQGGSNPDIRTLYYRCARFLKVPLLVLFVFDGPNRPSMKRNKPVSGKAHHLVPALRNVADAFGYECRTAPGEAEAELAHLNREGHIDAVLTDDVDAFLFGARVIIRNATLSGNKAHPMKNALGNSDGNHVMIYRSEDILAHPQVQLTLGGLILVGLLRGGDYHQGVRGFGTAIAHGLARCGFGDSLCNAARSLDSEAFSAFLVTWNAELRCELLTDSKGILGKKFAKAASQIPNGFPDVTILRCYIRPLTTARSESHRAINWTREPNIPRLATLCARYFQWRTKPSICRHFQNVIWPGIICRMLRRSALDYDNLVLSRNHARAHIHDGHGAASEEVASLMQDTVARMATERLSTLLQPARLFVESEPPLIVGIRSTRTHASTDGILEYRLEILPAQLESLVESGIAQGSHQAGHRGCVGDDSNHATNDDSDQDDAWLASEKKAAAVLVESDQQGSSIRMWIPASMVKQAEPALVATYLASQGRKRSAPDT